MYMYMVRERRKDNGECCCMVIDGGGPRAVMTNVNIKLVVR